MTEKTKPAGRFHRRPPMRAPRNEPPRPRPIVIGMLIGSGPGRASRASAPMMRPLMIRPMIRPSMTPFLRSQALEQTRPRARVLVFAEDAVVVELVEQPDVMRGVLGRVVA